jgi:hypothetical protein
MRSILSDAPPLPYRDTAHHGGFVPTGFARASPNLFCVPLYCIHISNIARCRNLCPQIVFAPIAEHDIHLYRSELFGQPERIPADKDVTRSNYVGESASESSKI